MPLPKPGDVVSAGLDTGMRSDSSALVIVHQRAGIIHVGEVVEMRPQRGAPLKPSEVIRNFANIMLQHGCTYAVGDAHYAEAVREYLDEYDLTLIFGPTRPADAYTRTRALMREGRVRMPRHDRLVQQLREVQGRPTSGGGMSITHPRTTNGGHGDLAAAFVLAVWQVAGDIVPDAEPDPFSKTWEQKRQAARKAKLQAELDKPAWMPGRRPY